MWIRHLRHSYASGELTGLRTTLNDQQAAGAQSHATQARYAHLVNDPLKSAAIQFANRFAEVSGADHLD